MTTISIILTHLSLVAHWCHAITKLRLVLTVCVVGQLVQYMFPIWLEVVHSIIEMTKAIYVVKVLPCFLSTLFYVFFILKRKSPNTFFFDTVIH